MKDYEIEIKYRPLFKASAENDKKRMLFLIAWASDDELRSLYYYTRRKSRRDSSMKAAARLMNKVYTENRLYLDDEKVNPSPVL